MQTFHRSFEAAIDHSSSWVPYGDKGKEGRLFFQWTQAVIYTPHPGLAKQIWTSFSLWRSKTNQVFTVHMGRLLAMWNPEQSITWKCSYLPEIMESCACPDKAFNTSGGCSASHPISWNCWSKMVFPINVILLRVIQPIPKQGPQ